MKLAGIVGKGVSEQTLQIAIVHHFRQLEVLTKKFTLFHVPNGGKRDKRAGALLKAMGVLPGVNDLIFLSDNETAIFIEVKAFGGRLSDNQKLFHADLKRFGFSCYTIEAKSQREIIQMVYDILEKEGVLL